MYDLSYLILSYRYQLPERKPLIFNPSAAQSRKAEASKRISASELKSHQNKVNYSDPRKFLIEHTQKAIRTKLQPRETKSSMKYYENEDGQHSHQEGLVRQRYDLSKREERILAAKKYRERIWKSNQIGNLIRAQQELMLSRRTDPIRHPSFQSQEKVQRYRDSVRKQGDENTYAQKEKSRKEQLVSAFSNHNHQNTYSYPRTRNPELQVTNIEFMEDVLSVENPVKLLLNREKKRQLGRRGSHVAYFSIGRRPNTTGQNLNKIQENFIQPW